MKKARGREVRRSEEKEAGQSGEEAAELDLYPGGLSCVNLPKKRSPPHGPDSEHVNALTALVGRRRDWPGNRRLCPSPPAMKRQNRAPGKQKDGTRVARFGSGTILVHPNAFVPAVTCSQSPQVT